MSVLDQLHPMPAQCAAYLYRAACGAPGSDVGVLVAVDVPRDDECVPYAVQQLSLLCAQLWRPVVQIGDLQQQHAVWFVSELPCVPKAHLVQLLPRQLCLLVVRVWRRTCPCTLCMMIITLTSPQRRTSDTKYTARDSNNACDVRADPRSTNIVHGQC